MNDCVMLQLLMLWLPCMRRELRLPCSVSPTRYLPSVHRCRPASFARPQTCTHTPASDNLLRLVLLVSVWTGLAQSVSTSICSIPWLQIAIRSTARKFARARKDRRSFNVWHCCAQCLCILRPELLVDVISMHHQDIIKLLESEHTRHPASHRESAVQ